MGKGAAGRIERKKMAPFGRRRIIKKAEYDAKEGDLSPVAKLRQFLRQSVFLHKQGRIHGNPVADGWAGAVPQKTLGIQKCDRRTDGPTDGPTDTARCRVACPRLKIDARE